MYSIDDEKGLQIALSLWLPRANGPKEKLQTCSNESDKWRHS